MSRKNSQLSDIVENLIESTCTQYREQLKTMNLNEEVYDDTLTKSNLNINNLSIFDFMREQQRKNKQKTKNKFYFQVKFLELLVNESNSLLLLFLDYLSNVYNISKTIPLEKEKQVFFNRITPLINLLNDNLYTMNHLLSIGMSHQVYLILRNYIEVGCITLAVLGDNVFADNYFQHGEENFKDTLSNWHKFYKPDKVEKTLSSIYTSMNMADRWEALKTLRDHCYQTSSKHSHGHFLTSLLETYSFENPQAENLKIKIFGSVTATTPSVFENLILIVKYILQDIIIFLVYHQELPLAKFGNRGQYHGMLLKVNEEMLKAYATMFVQKN
ncbi:hypothetical protein [Spirosoma pomorum]